MNAPNAISNLSCPQCGGELHPDEGQIFIICPYCGATVFVDKSRTVFHWVLTPTLNAEQAEAALRRWMSGSETVKDLDQKSQITGRSFRYFPLWYFRWKRDGQERIDLEPAAATSVTELAHLKLLAGDLRPYALSLAGDSEPPSVPLEAGMDWFRQSHPGAVVEEMALVHVPIYEFKYLYRGETYTAVVDAATGSVLANVYPAKAELPYRLVGGVTAVVFLCLASFPVIGGLAEHDGGAVAGFLLCSGIGVIAAPILMAWAGWVAARV